MARPWVDKSRKTRLWCGFDVCYEVVLVVRVCVCVIAVSKAFKTLENEEGYKRCQEIVEEAKSRVDEAVSWCCLVAMTTDL